MAKLVWAVTLFALSLAHAKEETCQGTLLIPAKVDRLTIETITPGTIVKFEDGKSFQILKVLSREGSSGIFLIPGPRILRVARFSTYHLEAYHTGYRILAEQHIPVPKMLGANPSQWIVSEFLDIEFLMSDMVSSSSKIADERFQKLLEEFKTFVFKFAGLNKISDLKFDNIAYVKNRGWVLIDWLEGQRSGRKLNPFLPLFEKEDSEQPLAEDRIRALRIASDETIAFARGQSVARYSSMTLEQYEDQLYGGAVK